MTQISRSSKLAFPVLTTLSAAWLAASTGCMEPPPESAEPATATAPSPSPPHTLVVSGPAGLTTIDLTTQKPVAYLATDDAVSAVNGDGRTNNNPDGSIPCYGPYILNATGSGRAVAAEFGYANGDNGMLRARTTLNALGPWEKWDICVDDVVGTWSFAAHNANRLVSAELDYAGGPHYAMLRARAFGIGPWERFIVYGNGIYNFLSYANGLFVSAEFGYQGYDNAVLRARALSAREWETFHLTIPPN
jgi:hypothetical protein